MAPGKKSKEIDLDEQIEFLKKVSFFHGFDDHELKQFLLVSKWLRVPPDTVIIKEGTTERAFYILVKGQVRVEKRLHGKAKPIQLTTLTTGDCFGEMALVTEIKRTADVVASAESFILRVEPEIVSTSNVFLQLKFYKRFCERLVARLDLANKRVAGRDGEEAKPSILQKVLSDDVRAQAEEAPARPPVKPNLGMERSGKEQKARPTITLPPMPDKEQRQTPAKLHPRVHPEAVFPVNPAVAAELTAMMTGGAGIDNTRRLADLISLDPVLSCRVIQTANSPFFRRANMVGTVPLAMVIIGVKQVQEVLVDTIRAAKSSQAFSGFTSVSRDFWQHAVVVGRIAEMLRDVIRINTSADLYLCGLLHDLGMLVLDGISPNFYPQFCQPSEELRDVIRAEKEYIGVDHGQAGVWLAEGIGLPQPYLDVMHFHHQPEKATTNPVPVAMINLANIFASLKGLCLGEPRVTEEDAARSFSWALIQEHHRPFQEVSVQQFVNSFSAELDKTWAGITGDMLL
ncbi:MAG: HDOD domain-containing protein [Proteobacteria bacterium]|nr:HDOD domain-containing protein [Pseudomonadota bacterium]MBU1547326.1 HDOD domain-containing protein [Pseudomonadota bacterium]MBU2620026.1 HDOD domain-containing protein [Pseudomonadota bacterium]